MRVRIHRGSKEIGGNCVEVEHAGSRIVLDIGRPLDARLDDEFPLPAVAGFDGGDPSLLGVVISHAHPDHYGLVPGIHASVPLYLGEATHRILKEAMFFSPVGADLRVAGHLHDGVAFLLGPFTITPYLVDHSAFDAYALLVEAGGKRLLYSGDLRAHGRKAALFERFVRRPPPNVDVLLLEGTNIRAASEGTSTLSEEDVENRCVELFEQTAGMVLAGYSGQNIDRLVTMHRAARRSGRTLVLDLYTASIAGATGVDTIPQGTWESIHVFAPLSQRIRVKRAEEFERVAAIRRRRVYPEDLAARADELVMTFRGSMTSDLDRADCLHGAHAVWSMWAGYLSNASGKRVSDWLEQRHIGLTLLHSSGHARVEDLQRFAASVAAKQVVPIHTSTPERFGELFRNVRVRNDGTWWSP